MHKSHPRDFTATERVLMGRGANVHQRLRIVRIVRYIILEAESTRIGDRRHCILWHDLMALKARGARATLLGYSNQHTQIVGIHSHDVTTYEG